MLFQAGEKSTLVEEKKTVFVIYGAICGGIGGFNDAAVHFASKRTLFCLEKNAELAPQGYAGRQAVKR